jgi:hypothetical protein
LSPRKKAQTATYRSTKKDSSCFSPIATHTWVTNLERNYEKLRNLLTKRGNINPACKIDIADYYFIFTLHFLANVICLTFKTSRASNPS